MSHISRKPTRLKDYDYSNSGCYFVTICTYKREFLFSDIVGQGLAPALCRMTPLGTAARQELSDLKNRFENVSVHKYVIMPNHIHMIIELSETAGASPRPTLSDVICAYKSLTVRSCRQIGFNGKIWQSSFYDHIIRGQADYDKICEYMENDPLKWEEDIFFKN